MSTAQSENAERATTLPSDRVFGLLRAHWGFDELRPMQSRAVAAALDRRDSLVVLPTGGGKSLCYQLPPLVTGGSSIIVSPLIALMQDQVRALTGMGVAAVALHSGMTERELADAERAIDTGEARLIYAAPERLVSSRGRELIRRVKPEAIVIDEAHCISQWGHDFRPEYRRLTELRAAAPSATWHAFTATATPRVQHDIAEQLRLRDPVVLVGDCDRPNLLYRVTHRVDAREQTLAAIRRHAGQAAIVYCISRRETESLAEWLSSKGVSAEAYHAGLTPNVRHAVQNRFMTDRTSVVVATVAFGMGIDRSDVRCVVHTAMPKSVEHYQQEAGRAGRDGLDAECLLLYSSADAVRWRQLMDRSAAEAGLEGASPHQIELLAGVQRFCASMRCRHRALAEYFEQTFAGETCGACDVCLNESPAVPDAVVITQKILSCVARLDGRFGVAHVVDVLRGSKKDKITSFGHDRLTVHGLMRATPAELLRSFVAQLVDQGALEHTPGDRPLIRLTAHAREYLRGEREVTLRAPKLAARAETARAEEDWAGVDRDMFERLRSLRRTIAEDRGIPAYMIFDDRTLRAMARDRPANAEAMLRVRGVGPKKFEEFGAEFLSCIYA